MNTPLCEIAVGQLLSGILIVVIAVIVYMIVSWILRAIKLPKDRHEREMDYWTYNQLNFEEEGDEDY